MTQDSLTVAHWAVNFSHKLASIEEWTALVAARMEEARDEKAHILLMPEHLSEHWMHFAPKDLPLAEETGWMAQTAAQALPALQQLSERTGVALVAGSTAWRHETSGKCRNRSWVLFPDRDSVFHDKLVMTPSEKDPVNGWDFEPGDAVKVFQWRGFNLSLVICLDIEMPHLSHRLAAQDIDLLLVPSMTSKPAGYHRVYSCARARAVELMTAVAVVGNVGGASHGGQPRGENYSSGAAVYIPSEEVFGHTGVFSDLPMTDGSEGGTGRVLYSRDIPLAKIRAVRHGKAEAWPGPWDAGHVNIVKE
ncbi:MAG: carbon-nitrogen hydrolase [Alphaproteobacteria bacterium]|nr:carbon-nitrogen hydrolase [Alphaproteobacteria bacterium]